MNEIATIPSHVKPVSLDFVNSASNYLPEPAVTGMGFLQDVASGIGNIAAKAVGTVASQGVGEAFDISGDYMSLIAQQNELQRELQLVSMISNIDRSKHETMMAPIRNLRVS